MQTPPVQLSDRWLEHWLLEPHLQPPLVQLSARLIEQVVQVPPSLPHALSRPPVQVLPWQQPPEQDEPVHTQLPLEQTWPVAHWALVPQAQVPVAEQLSARVPLHVTQAPPSKPQFETVGVLQVVPEQHPVGHPVLSQTQLPPSQC